MKIHISLLPGVLLVATDLVARIALQGLEQALVTTAIEYASAAAAFVSRRPGIRARLSFHR